MQARIVKGAERNDGWSVDGERERKEGSERAERRAGSNRPRHSVCYARQTRQARSPHTRHTVCLGPVLVSFLFRARALFLLLYVYIPIYFKFAVQGQKAEPRKQKKKGEEW